MKKANLSKKQYRKKLRIKFKQNYKLKNLQKRKKKLVIHIINLVRKVKSIEEIP